MLRFIKKFLIYSIFTYIGIFGATKGKSNVLIAGKVQYSRKNDFNTLLSTENTGVRKYFFLSLNLFDKTSIENSGLGLLIKVTPNNVGSFKYGRTINN